MKVREIMSTPVVTCHPEDTHEHAARLMWERDCGVLPVVDEKQRVVGVVTDRDLCMGAYTSGSRLGELQVARSMATRVKSCKLEDSLETALAEMAQARVRRLPVVDASGSIQGVVSIGDVLRAAAASDERGGRSSLAEAALATLSRISEPPSGACEIVPKGQSSASTKSALPSRGPQRGVTAG